MTKLHQALAGVTKLGFDTSPIIYFIESHPQYDGLVTEIFQRVSNGRPEGITSVITLTEVLIHPLRRGDAARQQQYSDLLINAANFQTLPHRHQDRDECCGLASPIQSSDPRCPSGGYCHRRWL